MCIKAQLCRLIWKQDDLLFAPKIVSKCLHSIHMRFASGFLMENFSFYLFVLFAKVLVYWLDFGNRCDKNQQFRKFLHLICKIYRKTISELAIICLNCISVDDQSCYSGKVFPLQQHYFHEMDSHAVNGLFWILIRKLIKDDYYPSGKYVTLFFDVIIKLAVCRHKLNCIVEKLVKI